MSWRASLTTWYSSLTECPLRTNITTTLTLQTKLSPWARFGAVVWSTVSSCLTNLTLWLASVIVITTIRAYNRILVTSWTIIARGALHTFSRCCKWEQPWEAQYWFIGSYFRTPAASRAWIASYVAASTVVSWSAWSGQGWGIFTTMPWGAKCAVQWSCLIGVISC